MLNAQSISLPLSRTTALVLGATHLSESEDETEALFGGAFDREVLGNDAWEKRLNARTFRNATHASFHHPDDAALVLSELPHRG